MTPHEIRPKQLRALLVLLALVPLIPTALMLRFMFDALNGERAVAMERMSAVYQRSLLTASDAFSKHLATRGGKITPQEAHDFYRSLLDRTVAVRIVDETGRAITGTIIPPNTQIAQESLNELKLPWVVQLHLLDQSQIDESVRDQFQLYAGIAGSSIAAVLCIAIAASLAVGRQLALSELKSTAVATVAHELRTPLASMRMLVDTLREGRCRDAQQQREYLDLIAGENLRLSRLAEDFLTFSRPQLQLTLEPVSPREVAEQAVVPLRARLEASGCIFTLDVSEYLPSIRADRDALANALTNLLDNALKYTGDEKRIRLSAAQNDGFHFDVTDNGPGIPHPERRRIFKPFHQSDRALSRSQGGCGLGLAIVERIATAHGGSVHVDDCAGGGSVFTLRVPLA